MGLVAQFSVTTPGAVHLEDRMHDMIPGSRSIDVSSSLAERDRIIHIGDDVGHLFIQVQKNFC